MKSKNNENVIEPLLIALASIKNLHSPNYGIITSSKKIFSKDLDSIISSKIDSSFAIGYVFSNNSFNISQKLNTIDDAILFIDGKLHFEIPKKRIIDQNLIDLAKKIILTTNGPFIFLIVKNKTQIIGRDAIGIQPFYFGQTKKFFAFASNRQILWNFKIDNPEFFPPGKICVPTNSKLKFIQAKKFPRSPATLINMEKAAKKLFDLINKSIENNLKKIDKCAIAFSGGLDSTLVAFIAKKYLKNLQLIHVSLCNNPEIEVAKKFAQILNLPIKIYEYEKSDVQDSLSKVIKIIEDPDPIKVGVGIPFFWAAEETKKLGYNTLLAGQGADELFGGYKRYLENYLSKNKKQVNEQMFNDINNLHESNLARDMKLCNYHGIELLCPFLTNEIIGFALQLPIALKIGKEASSLRKLVLRQVALDVGLPPLIVNKPKKAIQYSTKVNNILRKIAKKNKKSLSKYIQSIFLEQ